MCLALVGWHAHPAYSVVIASNRDEFFFRRTKPLRVWRESGRRFVAGVDVAGGGSWLGVGESGRFALVTNVRNGFPGHKSKCEATRSRGQLVTDYLAGPSTAAAYAERVRVDSESYRSFNMLVGDEAGIHYVTNSPRPWSCRLDRGVHGISNGSLNSRWPKVLAGSRELAGALATEDSQAAFDLSAYFDLLRITRLAGRDELPNTGVGKILERRLSAAFVKLGVYGTRSSTVVRISVGGGAEITERRFDPMARSIGETRIAL